MRSGSSKKILTVDDDEEIRIALADMLEMEGFETVWAKNGQVALEYLRRIPDGELPDLVLLDYMMPIMNGQQFYQEMRKERRLNHIPVVVMTANGNLVNVMERVNVGGFMSKPMDYDTVVKMVKHFLLPDAGSEPMFI